MLNYHQGRNQNKTERVASYTFNTIFDRKLMHFIKESFQNLNCNDVQPNKYTFVKDVNPKNNDGYTPFHIAAQFGHEEVCKFIIEDAKDKNPKNDKNNVTPLHLAAQNGHLQVCKLIMDSIHDQGWLL